MEREGGNKEKVRKGREWISPHFLIFSPFPLQFLILSVFSRSQAATTCASLAVKIGYRSQRLRHAVHCCCGPYVKTSERKSFLLGIAWIGEGGPCAQIEFDTFSKVKICPTWFARGGEGGNLGNAQKNMCFFSGKSSLWLTRWSVYHWCIKILWNRSFLGRPVLRYSLLKFVFYLISRSERSKRKISPWAEEKDKNSNNKKSKACTKSFRVFGEVFWRRPIRYINCINCIFCLQNWASR